MSPGNLFADHVVVAYRLMHTVLDRCPAPSTPTPPCACDDTDCSAPTCRGIRKAIDAEPLAELRHAARRRIDRRLRGTLIAALLGIVATRGDAAGLFGVVLAMFAGCALTALEFRSLDRRVPDPLLPEGDGYRSPRRS